MEQPTPHLSLSTFGSGSCRVCRGRRQEARGPQASRGAREVGEAASLATVGRALASREAMVQVCKTGLASTQCIGGQCMVARG